MRNRRRYNFTMSEDVANMLNEYNKETNIPKSRVLEMALLEYVEPRLEEIKTGLPFKTVK